MHQSEGLPQPRLLAARRGPQSIQTRSPAPAGSVSLRRYGFPVPTSRQHFASTLLTRADRRLKGLLDHSSAPAVSHCGNPTTFLMLSLNVIRGLSLYVSNIRLIVSSFCEAMTFLVRSRTSGSVCPLRVRLLCNLLIFPSQSDEDDCTIHHRTRTACVEAPLGGRSGLVDAIIALLACDSLANPQSAATLSAADTQLASTSSVGIPLPCKSSASRK